MNNCKKTLKTQNSKAWLFDEQPAEVSLTTVGPPFDQVVDNRLIAMQSAPSLVNGIEKSKRFWFLAFGLYTSQTKSNLQNSKYIIFLQLL